MDDKLLDSAVSPTSTIDCGPSSPKRLEDSSPWPTIANWDRVPLWLRDNELIVTGHPLPTFSYRKSLRLWRCLHNESVNIYSHFLGSAFFVATGISLLSYVTTHHPLNTSSNTNVAKGDIFAFTIFLCSTTLCFAFSSIFHTLRSHSYHVHHFWGRMDILGINILALGGGSSANYYAWRCNPLLQKIYWGLIFGSSAAAAGTLIIGAHRSPKWRTLRGGVFALLGVFAMVPVFHRIGVLGWGQAVEQIAAQWYLGEALSLLAGVAIFVTRMPEVLNPGSFDIWGSSHQLFHCCAVAGTAFHLAALVAGFKYRQTHPYCS